MKTPHLLVLLGPIERAEDRAVRNGTIERAEDRAVRDGTIERAEDRAVRDGPCLGRDPFKCCIGPGN